MSDGRLPMSDGRPDPAQLLGRASYLLLTTFRRDGTPVPTPVWVVPADEAWPGTAGDQLWVWTNPAAGKVKRLRRNGACEVAPCTAQGRPLGRGVPALGRILPESSAPRVLRALVRKYRLVGWLTTIGPRWGLAPSGAIGLRLTPDGAVDGSGTSVVHASGQPVGGGSE